MSNSEKSGQTRWYRISLRGLLVVTTILCVLFGYFGLRYRSAKIQQHAAEAVERAGGGVSFYYRLDKDGSRSPQQAAWIPDWLRERLGRHFFETVQSVHFGDPNEKPPVGDEALEILSLFPELRGVSLFRTQVTDAGMSVLAQYSNIHYLVLWHNPAVTEQGLKSIKQLRNLHSLDLYSLKIPDELMAELKQLPHLRELMLRHLGSSGGGITDEGMKHIGKMKLLTALSIDDCPITDEGLAYLENLSQLQALNLKQTNVTPGGIARLHEKLPQCQIEFK